MQANLNTILGAIRATGYTGLIVVVTYYSLDHSDVSGSALLNSPMVAAAAANGALVASGLDAWAATAAGGSSCTAGLLIALPGGIAASCPAYSPIGCLNRNRG